MANLDKVVYLSEAQKETLFTNGSITVDGRTINYSDTDLYVTPSAIDIVPVQGSSNLITSGAVYNAIRAGGTMSGDIAMGNHKITNLANGEVVTDAATVG